MKEIFIFMGIVFFAGTTFIYFADVYLQSQPKFRQKELCKQKGLELKTSAYDAKKKRFVIYCE